MADMQLKITMGDIEISLQGEGELVYQILKELREEGLGALHRSKDNVNYDTEFPSEGQTGEGSKEIIDTEAVAAKKTTKPKKKASAKQPQLIKDLDLSGKSVGMSLKDSVSEKKPSTNIERTAVFVYYMQNTLNIQEITMDHVFSCYKDIGARLPQNLSQNLNDTASSRYGYIETDNGKYTMSIIGINLIDHDLPKKE